MAEAPPGNKKGGRGLGKIWERLKSIFRTLRSAVFPKPPSASTTTAAATTTTLAVEEPSKQTPSSEPVPPPVAIEAVEPSAATGETTTTKPEPGPGTTAAAAPAAPVALAATTPSKVMSQPDNEAQARFEKTRAIFARYNFELNEEDWDLRPQIPYERVNKKIRMRVRYTCHNCNTTFGHDKICASCQHRRCSQCARYPPKKEHRRTTRDPSAVPVAVSVEPPSAT